MKGKLILADESIFEGKNFGFKKDISGEVVFSTGMMGYPESLTDPSYKGQILVLTYPLIGNYGVPKKIFWESEKIMVSGLVVSSYIDTPSHFQSKKTLADWFREEKIPLLEVKDTRALVQKIRDHGSLLGKIIISKNIPFYDPNKDSLVAKVSTDKITTYKTSKNNKTFLLIDCGAKKNILRALLKRSINVIVVPWDFDPFSNSKINFDGIVISNGPGDPKFAGATIENIKKALKNKVPILGICLGHQILALAAGGRTQKLKYGHRSQNQPCLMANSRRCFITTQNHGFEVSVIPPKFKSWFINANDGSNEGIIHNKLPVMSVQFHPEATPGPEDTEWIFDYFIKKVNSYKKPILKNEKI